MFASVMGKLASSDFYGTHFAVLADIMRSGEIGGKKCGIPAKHSKRF